MASAETQTVSRQPHIIDHIVRAEEDEAVLRRLEVLLAENAETLKSQKLYQTDSEKFEAELMRNPLTANKAYAYFGLMLGTFPPAAIFMRYIVESRVLVTDDAWIIAVLLIVNVVTAVVGYFSGKLIGRIVSSVETLGWSGMILLLPFIGLSGESWPAGPAVLSSLSSVRSSEPLSAALSGAAALPAFTVFHRLLQRGDQIEAKHFYPLALGVTLSICSFILGL
jgi:hypothetical protein